MALHEESVVFDTPVFMPRIAYDGMAIATAIDEGVSELMSFSVHLMMWKKIKNA